MMKYVEKRNYNMKIKNKNIDSSKKKVIVLLTNSFPYGKGEAFLETEILYLSQVFEVIYIIPTSKSTLQRDVPKNVYVSDMFINARISKMKRVVYTFFTFIFYDAIIKDFPDSLSISYLKLNFIWSFNTMLLLKILKNFIKEKKINLQTTIFYSYWFSAGTNAIVLLKNYYDIKGVTRVHGGDLYESTNNIKTFPYRNFALNHINKVFSISNDGVKHIENRYNVKNILLSRLGVFSRGRTVVPELHDSIHIVSCSYISTIKRVHLIAEIVKHLKYKKIIWTHFGIGNDNKLTKILTKIDNRIIIRFMGQKDNSYILNFYHENSIDLFINVSTSEGIPVSIMEAMSAGIPTLATDVGGTSEIVKDGYNGFLLRKHFDIKDAIEKLTIIKNRNIVFSDNAYKTWESEFNAEENYTKFSKILQNL